MAVRAEALPSGLSPAVARVASYLVGLGHAVEPAAAMASNLLNEAIRDKRLARRFGSLTMTPAERQGLSHALEGRRALLEGALLSLDGDGVREGAVLSAHALCEAAHARRPVVLRLGGAPAQQEQVEAARSRLMREVESIDELIEGAVPSEIEVLQQGVGGGKPHPRVVHLQNRLNMLGHRVSTDGRFGPVMTEAVKDFQAKAGIQPSGVVDEETTSALRHGRRVAEVPPQMVPDPKLAAKEQQDKEKKANDERGALEKKASTPLSQRFSHVLTLLKGLEGLQEANATSARAQEIARLRNELQEKWSPEARAAALKARLEHEHAGGDVPAHHTRMETEHFTFDTFGPTPEESEGRMTKLFHAHLKQYEGEPGEDTKDTESLKNYYGMNTEETGLKAHGHMADYEGHVGYGKTPNAAFMKARSTARSFGESHEYTKDRDNYSFSETHQALRDGEPLHLRESAKTAALSVTHAPIGKGGKNWITATKPGNTGQLPAYIQNIRNAIMRGGKDESSATAIAIGRVKDWAAGGGGVSAEVKAAAAKAVAEWEALKGKSKAKKLSEADARADYPGLQVPNTLRCPTCGARARAGAKTCPRGHSLAGAHALLHALTAAAIFDHELELLLRECDELRESWEEFDAQRQHAHWGKGIKLGPLPGEYPKLSPGRGPSGKLRNFDAMGEGKLKNTLEALAVHGEDPEAHHAAMMAAGKKLGLKLKIPVPIPKVPPIKVGNLFECDCGAPVRHGVCQRGHRLDEGELSAAEQAERSAAGKASAAKRRGLKQWSSDDKVFDGNSWDIDKLREGTPRHLDINPREGGTGVNVWVPGHHYSSANVTEQRGGIRGNQRTGRWEVSDADSYPLKSKEGRFGGNEAVTYDSPEEALNVAIAHAHKSHIAYDEGVHDAVGGPKVGPVMPVDPAALAKRQDADEKSLRQMAQGSMSPGTYDEGGRARLRAHGEASSDPELRKGAAMIAAHKMREALCECGAPARDGVCQRGHRIELREDWASWNAAHKGDERPRSKWRHRGAGRFAVGQYRGDGSFDLYRGANTLAGAAKAKAEVKHWPNAVIYDQAHDRHISSSGSEVTKTGGFKPKRIEEAIGPIKKGAFHAWLGKPMDEPITDADIARGLAAGGHPAKMAHFAKQARKWGK